MKEIDKFLDNYFAEWRNETHSRNLSWEHCYLFFKGNSQQILSDEKMLDLASLNLAFYLASWGMYRGSSNLLQKDYKVHTELIKILIKDCSYLWNEDITWEQLEVVNNLVKSYYKDYGVTPTTTLITKVLMGIFGCIPAYDRYFIQGLKDYNKNHEYISQSYNKSSFESLQKLVIGLKGRELVSNKKVDYPTMKLIDAYFWDKGRDME